MLINIKGVKYYCTHNRLIITVVKTNKFNTFQIEIVSSNQLIT